MNELPRGASESAKLRADEPDVDPSLVRRPLLTQFPRCARTCRVIPQVLADH